MTLPASGAISLSQVQSEFGGADSISMSEYYRTPNGLVTANNTGVPQSGAISMSQFHGTVKAYGVATLNAQYVEPIFGYGYGYYGGFGGSLSPDTWSGQQVGYLWSPNTGEETRLAFVNGWVATGFNVWIDGAGPFNFYWVGPYYRHDAKKFFDWNTGNHSIVAVNY